MRNQGNQTQPAIIIALDAETSIDITRFADFLRKEAIIDNLSDSLLDVIEDLSMSPDNGIEPEKRQRNMYLMFELLRSAKAMIIYDKSKH